MADVINALQVNIFIIYNKPEKNTVRNVIFFSYNRRSDKKKFKLQIKIIMNKMKILGQKIILSII